MAFQILRSIWIKLWRFVMLPKKAQWHNHINHVQAPKAMRHWLTETGSLTAKLIANSSAFRVQRVYQRHDFCWIDEFAEIGLTKVEKVHAREVVLRCNDVPTVYAHTVLPFNSNASQWPLFRSLGEKSLGSTLFGDPQVKRGTLQFARLQPNHAAMLRAQQIVKSENFDQPLFARRSLFYRRGGVMLVTELFLPGILGLS
jgi:chorismate--pyruvate lyase